MEKKSLKNSSFFCGQEANMRKRKNGEGSIYKRKDGRWCAAYYDEGYNRHYIYGRTKAEVQKKLKRKDDDSALKEKDEGNGNDVKLEEWVLDYLENYKKNEIKATTYSSYMIIFHKHIENSKIGKMELDKVTVENLQKFYSNKISDGYSSKTVRSIETIINSALEMAVKTRVLKENPNRYTTIPKKVRYEASVLTKDEVERLQKEAKDDELYPIVITTVYSGMRKGEVMALKWENVDMNEKRIFVKNSLCRIVDDKVDEQGHRHARYAIMEPKTKKSVRMIPMLDEVYEALLEQKRRQDLDKEKYKDIYQDQGFVFADCTGSFLAQRPFMNKYHKFLKKYNIQDIRFHDLRHTFASLLIEQDVSMKVVQELLGHSTITTSMDIYTHISDKKKEEAMQLIRREK